ncbi:MAG TPA: NAD(P)-dependent alcohol dehydrogenase [Candidatus Limnocylindrales bacterium]|nr:NAD(P)-dependent alcohol dehydrogenase [Candidatus Limnocylindrales bacterium]
MKAIVCHRYGSPDVLELEEIDTPVAGDDQVLVRVQAASVNPVDWHRMRGLPNFMRASEGLAKPKNPGLGADVAGRVEAVGGNVTRFQPGDEVFGMSIRTLAEYVCVSDQGVVPKPANLTFEEAAAVPVAAITALQGLRDKGRIEAGQKVLINGASGGVGTFAVQIAKSFGAEVTGVCSTKNVDLVRSIGADHVIDYTQEDFTRNGQRYDLIFDSAGYRSLSDCRRALGPDGILVIVGAGDGRSSLRIMARMLNALLVSRFGRQKLVPLMAKRNKDDLIVLKELIEAGKVTPVIDRSYPLSEVPEAIRYLEEGHARGKVVITL